MTWAEILTFSIVAGLLVMSPGPNGVLVAKTVPTSGRAAGFANVAGFVAAFYLLLWTLYGMCTVVGLTWAHLFVYLCFHPRGPKIRVRGGEGVLRRVVGYATQLRVPIPAGGATIEVEVEW